MPKNGLYRDRGGNNGEHARASFASAKIPRGAGRCVCEKLGFGPGSNGVIGPGLRPKVSERACRPPAFRLAKQKILLIVKAWRMNRKT